jgi:cytidylate kinase
MNNIFILLGPTASGKSSLSQKLADEFSFEIINALILGQLNHQKNRLLKLSIT